MYKILLFFKLDTSNNCSVLIYAILIYYFIKTMEILSSKSYKISVKFDCEYASCR